MKKFLLLFIIGFIVSCGQAPKEEKLETVIVDDIVAEESSIDISMLDTASIDSVSIKMSTLLVNTESAYKKVNEIKHLKEENKNLKKELYKSKTELNEIKSALADTIEGAD